MPAPNAKNIMLVLLLALIGAGAFSILSTLEINLLLKSYGLFATFQVGFALFFLSRFWWSH